MNCKAWFSATVFALASAVVQAKIVEEVVQIPVTSKGVFASIENYPMTVTVVRDDAVTSKQPFVVFNHGRSVVNVPSSKRTRFPSLEKYFVRLGYVVFVPTRPGYGITGGADVEDGYTSNYSHVIITSNAAADAAQATVKYAQAQSYVDPERGIVGGTSAGGTVAVLLAGRNLPGIKGYVNFAGGRSGNPEKSPGKSTRPDIVESMYKDAGKTSKMPTLWIYSENDRFWGSDVPKDWFAAFNRASDPSKNTFVMLPPYKEEGHVIYLCIECWKESFVEFEKKIGIKG